MDITLDYVPHRAQLRIHHARGKRFRIVCCGRRFGKTLFAAAEWLDIVGERTEPGLYAWIAPTYYIAERGERALQKIAGKAITFSGQNPRRAKFLGHELLLLSADSPDTILGEGYDGVIVDEAARIDGNTWQMYIRPALADKLGWALFITTPRGRNWFFDLFTKGRVHSPTNPYASFTFSSISNPYFPRSEWDEAKASTPTDVFRQEYEAEFLEDSAGVFRNIEACLTTGIPLAEGDVAIGCDLAKYTDFTWLIAMDRRTGACLDQDRFNQLDWPVQKERIAAFQAKWRAPVVMDSTGAGDPIFDDLNAAGLPIVGEKLSQHSKALLIQRLSVAIEKRHISWPALWVELTDELKRYEYVQTKNGFSYSAPAGFHDDGVIALALANKMRYEFGAFQLPRIIPRHQGPSNRPLHNLRRALP